MLKLSDISLKLEKLLGEENEIKRKLEEDVKFFDNEIINQKKLLSEKIKKINDNKNKKIKNCESRMNEIEKEKTFIVGSLSMAKLNKEISEEDFNALMSKLIR